MIKKHLAVCHAELTYNQANKKLISCEFAGRRVPAGRDHVMWTEEEVLTDLVPGVCPRDPRHPGLLPPEAEAEGVEVEGEVGSGIVGGPGRRR